MSLTISEMTLEQARAAAVLVRRVFDAHVAPGYAQCGIDAFHDYARAEALTERVALGASWSLVAVDVSAKRLVGVIEVRGGDHVSLLFVASEHQRRGIARRLYAAARKRMLAERPDLVEITVNASPNAVAAYERLGFRAVAPEQLTAGIRYVPMVHVLGKGVASR